MLLKYGDINKSLEISDETINEFKELSVKIEETLNLGKFSSGSNFKRSYKELDNYLVEILTLGFKVLGDNERFNYKKLFLDNINKYNLKDFFANNLNENLNQMMEKKEVEVECFNPYKDELNLFEDDSQGIIKEDIFFNRWYIYLASIEFITFYSQMSDLFWKGFGNRLDMKMGRQLLLLQQKIGQFLHKVLNSKPKSLTIYRDYIEELYKHIDFNIYNDNQVYLMDVFLDKIFYHVEFLNTFEQNLLLDELDKSLKIEKVCISKFNNHLFDYPNDFLIEFLFNKGCICKRNIVDIKDEEFDAYIYLLGNENTYKQDLKYLLNKASTKPVVIFYKNPSKVKSFEHFNISKILVLDSKSNIMDEKYKIIDYLNDFYKKKVSL